MSPEQDPTEFPEPTYQEAVEGWQAAQVRITDLERQLDEAQAENARLQARVEEAEAQVAVMAAGYDHADRELGLEKHVLGTEASLQLYRERIYDVRQKVRLSKAAKELLSKAAERDGYKARDKLRGDSLLHCRATLELVPDEQRTNRQKASLDIIRTAIDAIPEEAREKERQSAG